MKFLVITALLVAVSSGRLSSDNQQSEQTQQWPWQVGKVYRYDVESHTLARLHEGASSGSAFRTRLIVRVKAPGQLQARLENPQHAQVNQELSDGQLPQDLKYQPAQNLDKPFEINLVGGRVQSLNLPASVPLAQENLLKGLIGALQVDLSPHRNVRSPHDTYDKEIQQGHFRKMETDVTGDCQTLYTVSPVASEWRRELPKFAEEEEPIEITKSKNYGHCHHRVDYHFGVPEGAEWAGTAHRTGEDQLIKRATVSRILAGKQGPIYKAETTSTVHVHPLLHGKQKAEVLSQVIVTLDSQEQDSEPEWETPEGSRPIQNLLYSLTPKQVNIEDSSSSSSSSSSESHENRDQQGYNQDSPKNRQRRSSGLKKIVTANRVVIKKRSNDRSSSSDSSSSSQSNSAYINDDVPRSNEPAYAALYLNPQPHGDKKQNPMNAQKLVQEIAQQLQNPNNMPKGDFLSKFNILVRVIASMSSGQLSQTSRSIEIAKSSNNNLKSDMWMIYRDAVTQAGTLPAFQQIKTWIQTKKIQGEEAAEVTASLPNTLRYPTKELMAQFFELAMNEEVRQQRYLNNSALIAATKFINMGQVNNRTAHSYYPTHMYGRLSNKDDDFVLKQVLPRLQQELSQAVENDDRHKQQVYIKAIGNLGHRAILEVFAPYLEGQIKVSNYIRTQMVNNLQTLAKQEDNHARAVLFSILKNTAEHYEVRVAAIRNIFMGRPNSPMMQSMAEMTHHDPSIQVRAALKSTIESAAALKNPRYFELARTAQAAKDMLTKEEFGKQDSAKYFDENHDEDSENTILSVISQIGSRDNLWPKQFSYVMKNKAGGWDKPESISTSVSSVQRVMDYLKEQLFGNNAKDNNDDVNHKYSAKKVAQMLNIKSNNAEPLGASFQINFMNQERFFAFDEGDLQMLAQSIKQYAQEFEKGVDKHYTKVFNQDQISVMFPVATGMPFIYKYKEPTVFHIMSKAKGQYEMKSPKEYSGSMDKDIHFTYAKNIDGSVGFLDTLSNQHSSAGVVTKLQLYIPIKMQVQVKTGEVQVSVSSLEPEQDHTILHYSSWPYTANQKKDTLTPISQDPTTKLVARNNKVVALDTKFGQQVGIQFQLQGYSYSNDFKSIRNKFDWDHPMSSIASAIYQKDIAQTHFNLKHLGKQSKNKDIKLTFAYDAYYNQKQDGQYNPTASDIKDVSPNSEERRKELVKRAVTGINTAKAQVVDFSVTFEGAQKVEYVATAAIGDSPVDDKVQYAIFAGKNSPQGNTQINGVGKHNKPESTTFNYQEALKKDLKMPFDLDIRYGPSGNIHMNGQVERSKKYGDELKNLPLAKQCDQEIAQGNQYQRACYQMIIKSQALDSLRNTVTYKDVSPAVKNFVFQAYKIAESLGYWQTEVNPFKTLPEGRLEYSIEASYLTNSLHLVLNSRYGEVQVKNMYIPDVAASVVSAYRPINTYERVSNHYSRQQYQPYCSVDGTRVKTFSGRSYEYPLTKSWHVVMLQDAEHPGQSNEQVAILARKPNSNEKQQELYISYKSEYGKQLEIEIQPTEGSKQQQVKVTTNAKKVSDGDLTMYWDDEEERPILQYHTESDGTLMLNIREDRLRIMYDGYRSVVLNRESRNSSRGICGQMSGDERDDYLTPNGLVDRPEHYGASYALDDENSDPKTKQLKEQAKEKAYEPEIHYTTILRSDQEWKSAMHSSSSSEEDWGSQSVYRSRSYSKQPGPCKVQQQVQYYENHGEICITTKPLNSCQSSCRGDGYKVQAAQVVCRPKLDQQFRAYRDQIKQGQNPQVNGVPQNKQFRVPSSCLA
ncbi:vitellogenin [Papilio machaon]|uniref:vitellogenin n=1 Tax=Papilio machaon TaxID=76193 RepID=UPI001E664C5E|nr:vitellogenin [Papilio machaon]